MLLADEFEYITRWEGTTEGYEIKQVFSRYEDAEFLKETGIRYYIEGT
ncbi:MAG: hypothetical protein NC489_27870 [Ruminococcus flavefaciens]|nr:hypothetical protein [Ruminococcus flavefaciens]